MGREVTQIMGVGRKHIRGDSHLTKGTWQVSPNQVKTREC